MKLNVNNYKETLKAFNLPSFWEDQLKSSNLKDEGTALRILDDMSGDASSSAISNKTGSQNNNLRKHAKSIFMKFDSNDAFRFLDDDFDKDFNALDQVRIHDALKDKFKTRSLPLLMRWVNTAKDESFKSFLIQEIGYFQQKESADQLLEVFEDSSSAMVKSQIAKTLGKLDYKPALPVLIYGFKYNSTQVQHSIIYALGEIGGSEALDFLEKVYSQTHNKETLIEILKNIHLIDDTGMVFQKLKGESSSDFESSIFEYIEQGHSIR